MFFGLPPLKPIRDKKNLKLVAYKKFVYFSKLQDLSSTMLRC